MNQNFNAFEPIKESATAPIVREGFILEKLVVGTSTNICALFKASTTAGLAVTFDLFFKYLATNSILLSDACLIFLTVPYISLSPPFPSGEGLYSSSLPI